MIPGDYVYNMVGRYVGLVSHSGEVWIQLIIENGTLITTLRANCITLDTKPLWWPRITRATRPGDEIRYKPSFRLISDIVGDPINSEDMSDFEKV